MSIYSSSKGAAIITGSAQGIGLAIAQKLAEDGYGVVLADVSAKEKILAEAVNTIRSKGFRATSTIADVSIEQDVKNLVQKAVLEFECVDVMVANAGIQLQKPTQELTVEEWDYTFAVNARGTFLCYREAATQMIKQGRGGRIIGASSVVGKQGHPIIGAYVASKYAVRGLTQSAACDYGKYGITVNAYAPGAIDTSMMKAADEYLSNVRGTEKGAIYDQYKQASPLGILGTPEDIAGLVSYLVTPAARFITGQTVSINGGIFFD